MTMKIVGIMIFIAVSMLATGIILGESLECEQVWKYISKGDKWDCMWNGDTGICFINLTQEDR